VNTPITRPVITAVLSVNAEKNAPYITADDIHFDAHGPLIRETDRKTLHIYVWIITILGLVIDGVYFDITWGYFLPFFPDIPG
jgi:hypothetical protein